MRRVGKLRVSVGEPLMTKPFHHSRGCCAITPSQLSTLRIRRCFSRHLDVRRGAGATTRRNTTESDSALPYIRLASIALQQHQSSGALTHAKRQSPLRRFLRSALRAGRSFLEEGDGLSGDSRTGDGTSICPQHPKVHFQSRASLLEGRPRCRRAARTLEFERLNALLPGQQKSYGDRAARGSLEESVTPPSPNR